jgi:hypothetical protein
MKKFKLALVAGVAALVVASSAFGASGYVVTIGSHAASNAIPWWGSSYDSMRYQCLWLQSEIAHAGYINTVEFEKSDASAGTFNDVRVYLCHTTKTALEATFDNNYTGFTPVQVRTGGNLVFPASTGYFDIGITPNLFNYNNTNNLLMEVRWNGDTGTTCYCWRSAQANARVYASDHNAPSGSVQNNGQCIRLHIGTMTPVAPASLGHIKALLR